MLPRGAAPESGAERAVRITLSFAFLAPAIVRQPSGAGCRTD